MKEVFAEIVLYVAIAVVVVTLVYLMAGIIAFVAAIVARVMKRRDVAIKLERSATVLLRTGRNLSVAGAAIVFVLYVVISIASF